VHCKKIVIYENCNLFQIVFSELHLLEKQNNVFNCFVIFIGSRCDSYYAIFDILISFTQVNVKIKILFYFGSVFSEVYAYL